MPLSFAQVSEVKRMLLSGFGSADIARAMGAQLELVAQYRVNLIAELGGTDNVTANKVRNGLSMMRQVRAGKHPGTLKSVRYNYCDAIPQWRP